MKGRVIPGQMERLPRRRQDVSLLCQLLEVPEAAGRGED